MARLIDGDKVIERLDRIVQYWEKQGNFYEASLVSAFVNAILASEPDISQGPRWISVKERLPDRELMRHKEKYPKEDRVEVIVHIDGATEPTVLEYDGERFADCFSAVYRITHWMPLPPLSNSSGLTGSNRR